MNSAPASTGLQNLQRDSMNPFSGKVPREELWKHRHAEINGLHFHYVESGAGPLVLLLHGFPEFWYSWRRQIPVLAQAGFRVPTRLLSPYAREGFVDHRLYDHTSILRFLEWRFLGAPAHRAGRATDTWFLTRRDRYANNLGHSLRPDTPNLDFDVAPYPGKDDTSPACAAR